uniref:Uncharacterized protein n=1 Tax=Timema cristinae TaxID=61476 RepID=A0A7R9DFK2_TIMCR|nr:unnamed protein product [Timema cristinae]
MACVGELNTTVRGNMRCPILYGCGVNVKTGELFPANFPDKGPDQALRSARHFTGGQQARESGQIEVGESDLVGSDRTKVESGLGVTLGDHSFQVLDVYDCSLGLLRIGPFNYDPLRGVDLWLEQSDDFILQQLSTSPEVEPPHFVDHVRETLKYIQKHPFPAVTVFRDNRPHYYRRDENIGTWTPVIY